MPITNFNYVDAINQNLLCCICRMPFNDPFTTQTCCHTFCRDCILESLGHALQCPIDRSPLTINDLQPANPIIRSLVDELAVECVNLPLGCSEISQRSLLERHLQSSCLYVPVSCPEENCGQTMLRRDAVNHRCEHSLVTCDACSAEVKATELNDHRTQCLKQQTTCESCNLEFPRSAKASHQTSCPESSVKCPQNANGCPWKGKRRALYSEHISSCPYQALEGFFSLYNEQRNALVDENVVLKRRVETLENQVRTMEVEVQSARVALGPWLRTSGIRQGGVASISSPDTPTIIANSLQSPATPGSTTPQRPSLRILAPGIPALTSSQSAIEQDALAPYFPPQDRQSFERQQSFSAVEQPTADRQIDRPTRVVNRNSWSLGQSWEAMHNPNNAQPSTARPTKQTVAVVPPLNLNTTLEGSLAGLRESIVSLSSSVESLGRRNDLALTNETLRLNEELMSLKANMHGLRMQMHAIMMENAQLTGRADPLLFEHNLPPMSPHRYLNHYMPNSPSVTKL